MTEVAIRSCKVSLDPSLQCIDIIKLVIIESCVSSKQIRENRASLIVTVKVHVLLNSLSSALFGELSVER